MIEDFFVEKLNFKK
jgi:hypothetical protein